MKKLKEMIISTDEMNGIAESRLGVGLVNIMMARGTRRDEQRQNVKWVQF